MTKRYEKQTRVCTFCKRDYKTSTISGRVYCEACTLSVSKRQMSRERNNTMSVGEVERFLDRAAKRETAMGWEKNQ
jgi:hypothetical protein